MIWHLSYPTTVLNERMWHFRGSKHTLTLLHIFRGQDSPNPHDLHPCSRYDGLPVWHPIMVSGWSTLTPSCKFPNLVLDPLKLNFLNAILCATVADWISDVLDTQQSTGELQLEQRVRAVNKFCCLYRAKSKWFEYRRSKVLHTSFTGWLFGTSSICDKFCNGYETICYTAR